MKYETKLEIPYSINMAVLTVFFKHLFRAAELDVPSKK